MARAAVPMVMLTATFASEEEGRFIERMWLPPEEAGVFERQRAGRMFDIGYIDCSSDHRGRKRRS